MYNIASTAKIQVDYSEPINNRSKLDTGTQCNYDCVFCYYRDKLNEVTNFSIIKERIDYLVSCGITEVDLSGGESSIHKDWFKILDYCKDKGLKISTLSNGFKFADFEFLKKSKEHGLEEILFSVHGYDKEVHNALVNNKNGFSHITTAIENSHALGIKVRINCTVTNNNYLELDTKFVELMKTMKPLEVNFLTLNYWDNAKNQDIFDYETITPYIHKSIDSLKHLVKYINVRYTPYCFMKGYEKYVCNYYQHIYDVYDWNIALYEGAIEPSEYKKDPIKHLYETAKKSRLRSYYKPKECFNCSMYFICDGIEKRLSNTALKPYITDEKIYNVNHFRKGFYNDSNEKL